MRPTAALSLIVVSLGGPAGACELCAIYNADAALNRRDSGFSVAVAEQYVPYGTVQLNGNELPHSILDEAYVDTSITHIAPTWSASDYFGLSLSLPVIHHDFQRLYLTRTGVAKESGEEFGIGDLSIVARSTVYRIHEDQFTAALKVLAGVKFPTGDASRVAQEVDETRILDGIYGPGHQHAVSGVHLRDLTLGSGSYDGIFGLTAEARWTRWFVNAQFQYYLRTEGESDYRFGDEAVVSGGPGGYLVMKDGFTLGLQAVAVLDHLDPDELDGRENRNTGLTAVYLGPQFSASFGEHFSANLGVDVPIDIDNHGLQNVPDFRLHFGLSYRF